VVLHEMAQRLAAAWERAFHDIEVMVHSLRAHAAILTPDLLILTSGVGPANDMFYERSGASNGSDQTEPILCEDFVLQ